MWSNIYFGFILKLNDFNDFSNPVRSHSDLWHLSFFVKEIFDIDFNKIEIPSIFLCQAVKSATEILTKIAMLYLSNTRNNTVILKFIYFLKKEKFRQSKFSFLLWNLFNTYIYVCVLNLLKKVRLGLYTF